MDLSALLRGMLDRNASALHLVAGETPSFRVDGAIIRKDGTPISDAGIDVAITSALSTEQRAVLLSRGYVDTSLRQEARRFLCRVFRERGRTGASIRVLPADVPTIAEISPMTEDRSNLAQLIQFRRGLIVVTGTRGSGRSTVCSALLNAINMSQSKRIVTVEEPVEYDIQSRSSLVTQHMVGQDVDSFKTGAEIALAADADVIYLSAMPDYATFDAAMTLVERGKLVISISDEPTIVTCVRSLYGAYPQHSETTKALLSQGLQAIVSTTLVPKLSSRDRVPAFEILIATLKVRGMLQEGRWEVAPLIKDGRKIGMQTLDDSLIRLHEAGLVSIEELQLRISDKATLASLR